MGAMSPLEGVRSRWVDLPRGLYAHLERVSYLAGELAVRWDADPEGAALAGFLHDVARAEAPQVLLAKAREFGLPVSPVEKAVPLLLHGPVGAALARPDLKDQAEEVAAAIAWHSTAHEGMSVLEKVVFLADKLDPEKQGPHSPGLEDLPSLAKEDLDQALVYYLRWQMRHILERGGLLHPATVEAHNWLLFQLKDRTGT